jgi:hypothetical protein
MNSNFIKQTAKDYDLPYCIVENIYKRFPDNFYDKLEEEINNRRNK